mmetsp:Transcript_14250/g.43263  ORF Transcript_14250/g.43263 Transcript_14250/m.43263 type:complete len:437 (-) Transcript_14250:131-1441(-)
MVPWTTRFSPLAPTWTVGAVPSTAAGPLSAGPGLRAMASLGAMVSPGPISPGGTWCSSLAARDLATAADSARVREALSPSSSRASGTDAARCKTLPPPCFASVPRVRERTTRAARVIMSMCLELRAAPLESRSSSAWYSSFKSPITRDAAAGARASVRWTSRRRAFSTCFGCSRSSRRRRTTASTMPRCPASWVAATRRLSTAEGAGSFEFEVAVSASASTLSRLWSLLVTSLRARWPRRFMDGRLVRLSPSSARRSSSAPSRTGRPVCPEVDSCETTVVGGLAASPPPSTTPACGCGGLLRGTSSQVSPVAVVCSVAAYAAARGPAVRMSAEPATDGGARALSSDVFPCTFVQLSTASSSSSTVKGLTRVSSSSGAKWNTSSVEAFCAYLCRVRASSRSLSAALTSSSSPSTSSSSSASWTSGRGDTPILVRKVL